MAIIVDKDGNVVTVENEPEAARAMFPNINQDFSAEIASILDRLSIIHPGIHPGTIGSSGAINPPTEVEAGVYTDEFPVTPGDTVNYSLKYSEVHLMMIDVVFYDASHTFIQRKTLYLTSADMYEGYFVVPDNVYYCRFSYITYNEGYLNIKTSGQRLNDVQCNGESIVVNGVGVIPDASTEKAGVVKLSKYVLIASGTLDEDSQTIAIIKDSAGNDLKLTDMYLSLYTAMYETDASILTRIVGKNRAGGNEIYLAPDSNIESGKRMYIKFFSDIINGPDIGRAFKIGPVEQPTVSSDLAATISGTSNIAYLGGCLLQSTPSFKAGTSYALYGVIAE